MCVCVICNLQLYATWILQATDGETETVSLKHLAGLLQKLHREELLCSVTLPSFDPCLPWRGNLPELCQAKVAICLETALVYLTHQKLSAARCPIHFLILCAPFFCHWVSMCSGYVAKECIDTLVSPLKSITSLYRMTKKPVPMRFSFFIPTILTAAQNFQQCCTPDAEKTVPLHCRLSKPVLDDCVRAVLKQVTKVYHDEAKALLITAKKAETAVSALRKKQKKVPRLCHVLPHPGYIPLMPNVLT